MGFAFNPFTGNFDQKGSGGGGGGSAFFAGEVATYADLPLDGSAALDSRWLVRSNSGTWPFSSYKQAGVYVRKAIVGASRDNDYQLTDTSFHDVMSDAAFLIYDDGAPTRSMQVEITNNETLTFKVTGTDSIVRSVAFALSAIVLAFLMASSAIAQNIGLVSDTNGNIVTRRTNALSFTNSVAFSNPITFGTNAATTRTNLGLTAPWLTNTTNAGGLNRYLVSSGELGELVTWADVPSVIAGSYTLKGNSDDPYNMDATNVLAYFYLVNQWRIHDVEGFKAALFATGNFILNKEGDFDSEDNTTISATTIEARYYSSINGSFGGRVKIGGINNAQWELLGGTDGNANIIRTNYLPSVSGELVTTTLTNVSAPAARTNLGLGSLATNNSVPSGEATTNSLLTADGAGGSSFVASRVQRVTLTNNFAVTNYTDLSVTNGNVPNMAVNLEANSLYVARWHVLLTCGAEGAKLEATAGATNGIPDQSVAGRLGRPGFSYGDTYFLGSGARRVMSLIGFSGGGFTSGVTNGVFNGVAQFRTGVSNTTLFWRFAQNSASNVATTILSNSIFYVEKLSP